MTSATDALAADYAVLRRGAGVAPMARDVVRVTGPDAVDFLQGQCSQDVAALEIGTPADALLLSPQGKLDAMVRVTRLGADDLIIDVRGGWGPTVTARLERFKIRVKASIEVLDWSCVALRGPESAALVEGAVGSGPEVVAGGREGAALVLPFEWGSVRGVDLLGPSPAVPAGATPCGAPAWEAIRIEAGIPDMGAELDERTIAAEAGLLERCVSLTKGCYTGQELVARLDARGNRVARHLRGLVVVGPGTGDAIGASPAISTGDAIGAGDAGARVLGTVTSSAWSPGLGATVALAYLHRDVHPPATVAVTRPDGSVIVAEARQLPLTH